MHECRNEPKSFNSYGMFTPAESNDIWNGCIPRTIKGTLVNFWCWVSWRAARQYTAFENMKDTSSRSWELLEEVQNITRI